MKKYLRIVRRIYFQIINSIAFYPSLIALAFFMLAVGIMYIEYMDAVEDFKEKISFLLVADKDTAKSVLTTLVASLISLTVFSFSMVMVVLNTAASNLSPRVLPGLVSKKAHQVVLGVYLGSIIYCLILIINVQKNEESYQTPTLGVLLAMVFGIICLGLFVYFIDSISRTIQTDHVLNQIFNQTRKRLQKWTNRYSKSNSITLPNTEGWFYIYSNQSGYFKDMARQELCKLLAKHNLEVYVRITKGFFTVKGFPLISVNRDITDDEELIEEILGHFTFFVEEYARDHYSYGFRQISEIAVKALSPGINDPGTAIRAVDMLSILYIDKMGLPDFDVQLDEEDKPRLYYREYNFKELLFEMLTPIRGYGHSDTLLMMNLIEACKNMLYSPHLNDQHEKDIAEFLRAVAEDAASKIENSLDQSSIDEALAHLPKTVGESFKGRLSGK
jgi:uncharacterized membrane protein